MAEEAPQAIRHRWDFYAIWIGSTLAALACIELEKVIRFEALIFLCARSKVKEDGDIGLT